MNREPALLIGSIGAVVQAAIGVTAVALSWEAPLTGAVLALVAACVAFATRWFVEPTDNPGL